MTTTKKVYFVRHGEAAGNSGGFSQTPTTPLTTTGEAQAQKVAQRFKDITVDTVLASHYDRAQNTAKPIASIKDLPLETTEYFHEWVKPTSVQGAAHSSEAFTSYMQTEKANYTNPEWRFEDGENFADILSRVSSGIEMLEQHKSEHIVVVTHGRLLRFITAYLLHRKELTAKIEQRTAASMWVTNTGITLFEFEDASWRLRTFNDIAHFAE